MDTAVTGPLVLPADAVLVPARELPGVVRERAACDDDDFALTHPRSRTPSRIVSADTAALLREFRTPKRIVEAVIAYSRERDTDPEEALVDAFPVLQELIASRLLVPADSVEAEPIAPSIAAGKTIAGYTVQQCIHVVEDSEIYQVKDAAGGDVALKIWRPAHAWSVAAAAREAAILEHLDGGASPRLLEHGQWQKRPFLAMEWLRGVPVAAVADELRAQPGGRDRLLRLCCAVLDAYAALHAQQIVHGDVHPRNILVDHAGAIRIIDFGLSHAATLADRFPLPIRGGVSVADEPEYATASATDAPAPPPTPAGEQYAVGALLYLLLTGQHYLAFSLDAAEMHRQIAEDPPLPFAAHGARPSPNIEALLGTALAKRPSDRFPSVEEFARAMRALLVADAPRTLARTRAEAGPAGSALLDEVLQLVGPGGRLYAAPLPPAPACSVNYGAAGIAYALYRIACVRDDAALLSLADIWATRAHQAIHGATAFYDAAIDVTPETVGRISPYHSASGVHCVRALIAQAMGDLASQQSAIVDFMAVSRPTVEGLDLTLGRAGSLLACALLLDALPAGGLLDSSPLQAFGEHVFGDLWERLSGLGPLHTTPELVFSGIAHGWAGALYATLRWCEAAGSPIPDRVAARLEELAGWAEPVGRGVRWRAKFTPEPGSGEYYWVPGWCNGSAGFVYLWTLAHRMLGDNAYARHAEAAAWNAWETPGGPDDLCCGRAGRAHALLHLHHESGDPEWWQRAQSLAEQAAAGVRHSAYRHDTLYKGEIGVAVLAAEVLRPERACMPLFGKEA